MSKKIKNQSSNSQMNSVQNMEDLLNYKFNQRIEVSKELHFKILESTTIKNETRNTYWYVAAGLAILITLNIFSIQTYHKQVKNEQLKEYYTNNWNNSSIY
ncbi:MAG: hypothetical protein ACOVQG_09675 [Crocinitomicaceae bacterium]|jgi:hypothetical protein